MMAGAEVQLPRLPVGPPVGHAQVAAIERVLHREEAASRPFPAVSSGTVTQPAFERISAMLLAITRNPRGREHSRGSLPVIRGGEHAPHFVHVEGQRRGDGVRLLPEAVKLPDRP